MNNPTDNPSQTHLTSLQAARNLMNIQAAAASTNNGTPDPTKELYAVTAGQVADLAHFQTTAVEAYEPIDPFALSERQAPPQPEAGRLQTRMHALQSKLYDGRRPATH